MFADQTIGPDMEMPAKSHSSRDEQRRRNALARSKLEVILEYKRLREQLSDVWDEAGRE